MGSYRLVALDMDGTLLNEQSKISPENERWVRAATQAGVYVCLTTGRGYQSALPFAEQLGLETPMVLVNGSEVWETPTRLHSRTLLPGKAVAALRELAMRHDSWYWAYCESGVYNKENWVDDISGRQWLKFGFHSDSAETRAAVLRSLPSVGEFETTNSHPHNIELNPKGVSKASGLHQVCGLLGLGMHEIVACGDSLNDLAMVREAGLGVAMGNAQEELKQIADIVALTNEEDGVAQVIKTFVL